MYADCNPAALSNLVHGYLLDAHSEYTCARYPAKHAFFRYLPISMQNEIHIIHEFYNETQPCKFLYVFRHQRPAEAARTRKLSLLELEIFHENSRRTQLFNWNILR